MTNETIVWISGASSGIGAGLAATVPFPDARIIDISRSGAAGAEHVAADLAEPSEWGKVAEHFRTQLAGFEGQRAVFVHNAGMIDPVGFAGEVDTEAYQRNVLLNCAAPQVLGHAFLAAVKETGFAGESHLVMMTSGAANKPYEGWSSYSAGKASVDMWVRCAGAEQERRGSACRVLAVAPGTIATAMQERLRASDVDDFPSVAKFRDLYESGQLRDPTDAARGVWAVLGEKLDNGSVVDLRSLAL